MNMNWFNYFGLIAVAIILLPNILAAVFDKRSFENKCKNKFLIVSEQIGRYGCIGFSVFNIPYTYFDLWFDNALAVYLIVGGCLLVLYLLGWVVFRKRNGLFKSLWLSIVPTIFFLFCGVVLLSVPLIVSAVLFGIGHIAISCKNTN